jgi:hypothetical protein
MRNAGFDVDPSAIAQLRADLESASAQVGQAIARARDATLREPAMGDDASQEFQRAFAGTLDEELARLSAYQQRLDGVAARLQSTQHAYDRQDAAGAGGLRRG